LLNAFSRKESPRLWKNAESLLKQLGRFDNAELSWHKHRSVRHLPEGRRTRCAIACLDSRQPVSSFRDMVISATPADEMISIRLFNASRAAAGASSNTPPRPERCATRCRRAAFGLYQLARLISEFSLLSTSISRQDAVPIRFSRPHWQPANFSSKAEKML
jgi:hypothetical protein